MIVSLLLVLACYFCGSAIADILPAPVPGPIIGLLLLLLVLRIKPALLTPMAKHVPPLLSHLTLLFLPATVGIMASYTLLEGYWTAIIIAIAASTLLSLLVGVAVFRLVDKRR